MKKSIFAIGTGYLSLIDQIEELEGEVTPEIEEKLSINESELQSKSIAYIQVIKKIDGDIETIDKEIKRLQAMKSANSNLKTRLKDAISDTMKLYGVEEIKTSLNKISFRKSKAVVIEDIELLPPDCIIIEKKSISKKDLKTRLSNGEKIKGVSIVENKSLSIK